VWTVAHAVKAAIDQGADVTYQHDEGVTALMTAAENGHVEIVTQLLQAGAPWNQQVMPLGKCDMCCVV